MSVRSSSTPGRKDRIPNIKDRLKNREYINLNQAILDICVLISEVEYLRNALANGCMKAEQIEAEGRERNA